MRADLIVLAGPQDRWIGFDGIATEVFAFDHSAQRLAPLTDSVGRGHVVRATLSADGQHLAYLRFGQAMDVCIRLAAGGPATCAQLPVEVSSDAASTWRISWLAGRQQVLAHSVLNGKGFLYEASKRSAALTPFPHSLGWSTAISPDGRRVAYRDQGFVWLVAVDQLDQPRKAWETSSGDPGPDVTLGWLDNDTLVILEPGDITGQGSQVVLTGWDGKTVNLGRPVSTGASSYAPNKLLVDASHGQAAVEYGVFSGVPNSGRRTFSTNGIAVLDPLRKAWHTVPGDQLKLQAWAGTDRLLVQGDPGHFQLHSVSAGTSTKIPVDLPGHFLGVSPDGDWLALLEDKSDYGGELYLFHVPAGRRVSVDPGSRRSNLSIAWPGQTSPVPRRPPWG